MRTSGILALCLLLVGPASALAKPSTTGTTGSTGTSSKQGKKGRTAKEKEKAPCYAPEVHVQRRRGTELEDRALTLTFCDGAPNPAALDSVSVLARPRDVERPELAEIRAYQRLPVDKGPKSKRRDAAYVSKQVMRLHPGLISRLQRVASRFPGKAIEIISGHRPDARDTSRHHHGRALDMRVGGVSREVLRDFLRTFPETGVGYYPNSFFVHMDVRDDKGYWVDRSGPGEAPDYGPWPPKKSHIDHDSEQLVESALKDLAQLESANLFGDPKPAREHQAGPRTGRALSAAQRLLHAAEEAARDEDDDMGPDEIERIRKEARAAIEAL
ncbi:MAG: DUF882 domain-containing protein [Myxococcales bacterium]